MTSPIISFLNGGTCVSSFFIAVFFWRFYKKTADRLFLFFSFSFLLFVLERIVAYTVPRSNDSYFLVFTLRLIAFALIIYSIWEKNRLRD